MRRRRLRRTRADCPLCGMVRRAARPTQGPRQRCVGAPLTDPAVGSVSLGGSLVRTCLAPSPSRLLHVPSGAMDSRYVREADGVPGQGAPGELLLCNLSDDAPPLRAVLVLSQPREPPEGSRSEALHFSRHQQHTALEFLPLFRHALRLPMLSASTAVGSASKVRIRFAMPFESVRPPTAYRRRDGLFTHRTCRSKGVHWRWIHSTLAWTGCLPCRHPLFRTDRVETTHIFLHAQFMRQALLTPLSQCDCRTAKDGIGGIVGAFRAQCATATSAQGCALYLYEANSGLTQQLLSPRLS